MNSFRSLKSSVIASVIFVIALFVGLPMLWLVAVKAKMRQAEAEVAIERKAAQAEKLPLTANDMRRSPPVPDADNAAPIYQQIFAGFTSKKQELSRLEQLTEGKPIFGQRRTTVVANMDAARKLVALLAPEFALMEQAAQKPDCDFHRPWEQGTAMLMPEYADMRRLARLLRVKLEVLERDGKLLEALRQIEIGGALVRHLGQDSILIGMLVQVAIEAILDWAWHDLVNRHGDDLAFLNRAAKVNKAFGELPTLKFVLRGEVWYGMYAIGQMKDGTYKEDEYSTDDEVSEEENLPKLNPKMASVYEKNQLKIWRRVFERLDETQGDTLKSALVMVEVEQQLERDAKNDPAGFLMAAQNFPTFSQSGYRIVQIDALRQMRTLKIELLKSRVKNGIFPKDLKAFDVKMTTDPFTGKPLIYRVEGKGFILYSVGQNGIDDGGQRKVGGNNMADIVTTYP